MKSQDVGNLVFKGSVGIFFLSPDGVILHLSPVEHGERCGDFINYPHSHDEVWEKNYSRIYQVDFDFFPRGRIVYHEPAMEYWVYYDDCATPVPHVLPFYFKDAKVKMRRDEHYQCLWCNPDYSDGILCPSYNGWVPSRNCVVRDKDRRLAWPPHIIFRNISYDA